MSTAAPDMTIDQLLVMPENDMDRELIRGQLREKPMTYRNRFHAFVVMRIAHLLSLWLDNQSKEKGGVLGGEAGCILRRDPDTVVGIDVAYFSAEVLDRQTDATTLVDGAPHLAVEVLSPSDKHEEIHEKVTEYLAAGVALVWIVDPDFKTVQVHRPGIAPEMFNETQSLTGGDVLPGLEIAVADIFKR